MRMPAPPGSPFSSGLAVTSGCAGERCSRMVFISGSEESGAKPLSPLSVCVWYPGLQKLAPAHREGHGVQMAPTVPFRTSLTRACAQAHFLLAVLSDSLVHFLWVFTLGSNVHTPPLALHPSYSSAAPRLFQGWEGTA